MGITGLNVPYVRRRGRRPFVLGTALGALVRRPPYPVAIKTTFGVAPIRVGVGRVFRPPAPVYIDMARVPADVRPAVTPPAPSYFGVSYLLF